jgi:hypothetical protein
MIQGMDSRTAVYFFTGRSMMLAVKLMRIEAEAAMAGRRPPADIYALARDARRMNSSLRRAVEVARSRAVAPDA